ncbi:glycosyltransferase family 4 protein [Rhodoplanes roseus]|uniref:Glycosyl transferase family 1 domain-containing protein n=1 Tax=Rhodoplanes roseus TaxID=29409 RepID=A0A327KZX8_9BRAD|nr:glycosyltransferase family 4 protein [Rhodoplanes roseus]RAI43195.1 hypothetical protein CH341_15615 [Rhodoplanes roseus]
MFTSVVHVTPAVFGDYGLIGGAERYVHSIAKSIGHNRNIRQSVLGFSDRPGIRQQLGGIDLHVVPTDSFSHNRMDWYGGKVWEALDGHDLVHVHQPFTRCGEVALLAAAQQGKIIVATDLGGGMPPRDGQDHPVGLAHRIVAISEFSAEMLGHLKSIPIDVISGPVDDAFLEPPVIGDKRGALFVGRLLPHKGVDRLIKAAPPELDVTIAGETHDLDYMAHLNALARNKRVTFVEAPSTATVRELYIGAAVHVAPSVVFDYRGGFHPNSELMGLTTIEAMCCGTPVAVANTCSLPAMIDPAVGEVFDDEAALADILARVQSGEWSRRYAPATVRDYALARFAPAVVADRLMDSYRKAEEAAR